ncbi:MAG: lipopolysaccharide biosynthesis protein [Pedobacter sp.]
MNLKQQAISGMIWSYSQQFSTQLISFLVSVCLARILIPEEFGLIGMLSIFIGVGSALFEGGLTSSLIRSKSLDHEDYSTVFYFNLGSSLIIYFSLYLLAPSIADFFHQTKLIAIARLYGLTFIISAFGAVQNTILTREMKFKKQTLIAFPALVISSIVGLVSALKGFGVWSLVYSALANAIVTSLFLWLRSDWYPRLTFDRKKFYYHFNYGYKLTFSAVLDIIFSNIYQLVIGRYYSSATVGYYTRANTLLMLPVGNVSGALNKVVFPLFSKMQNDIDQFRAAYKKIMLMVLFIISPIIVFMAVAGRPLIILLFTEKWLPVVPIFQVICFTGILYPIHLYNLLVLQVKGRSDLFLKLEIIKKLLQGAILLISFYYGFFALLWGQVLFSTIALLINTHYAGRMLKYNMLSQLKDLFPILLFSLFMGITISLILYFSINYSSLIQLTFGGIGGILAYLTIAWFFKFQSINDITNIIYKR